MQIEGIRSISYVTKEGPFVRAGNEYVNEAEIFNVQSQTIIAYPIR